MENSFKSEQNKNNARIVGKASPEHKKQVEESFGNLLWNHLENLSPEDKQLMEQHEMKKTPEHIELINFANQESSRLMKEFGIETYDIPVENIHVVPRGYFASVNPLDASLGKAINSKQAIIIEDESGNHLHFGRCVFHELIHMKGYCVFDVQEGEIHESRPLGPLVETRSGLLAHTPFSHEKMQHEHFRGLNEAIVSEAEYRFTKKLFDQPLLKEYKKDMESLSAEDESVRGDMARDFNVPKDYILWLRKTSDTHYTYEIGSYPQHREALSYVYSEIQKQFPEKYSDIDSVYNEFLSAQFTGKLFLIARLIENTFGEGSFRILGNMTDKPESAVVHLETLKGLRSRYKKQNNI